MNELGLIQVYTGAGKGKTTAAIGAGIRAVGQGLRVHMIQFLKGGENFPPYGEVRALALIPRFTLEQFGPSHFIEPGAISDEDREIIKRGLERAEEILSSGNYDLVILDEINVVLNLGMATLQEVLDLLDRKARQTEVLLTGRGAPEGLLKGADLVSRIDAVKHPFDQGIQARLGIEY
ncbi:MAG: cob(I)yrinic acid a,c-diamide adenosyltransferase [Candidatus Bipolaricaulota bacterium]|nr:cob(I)yrinic acid a,c-diamide adenosyltransferase [Candidatus Bipolaricaulota bacterium]